MIDKNTIKRAVGTLASDFGFVKAGSCWYLTNPDAIALINLQKSDHGNYYYLNAGIQLRALGEEKLPKTNTCHIQFAINILAGDDAPLIVRALDLDSADEEDLAAFLSLMKTKCLPSLSEMTSLSALRENYRDQVLKRALLLWQAREFLESDTRGGPGQTTIVPCSSAIQG